LQNLSERGSQNAVPTGTPSNVSDAATFNAIDHGRKLPILRLSTGRILKGVYREKSFDNRLRNGINHYKARLHDDTQVITYFPITAKPNKQFSVKYIDFLAITLDAFNSVLKIGQLMKVSTTHKAALEIKNKKKT
jgi:hypothetical protein